MLQLALLAQAASGASRVGVGRIVGGWDFVGAAYGVAWTALVLYALSLWVRRPRASASPSSDPRRSDLP
jgi:hypothetical protein